MLQLALNEPDDQVAVWSVDKGRDHVEGRPLVLQLALDEPYGQGWAKLVLIALERYSVALKRLTLLCTGDQHYIP